ncbi:MULTISPECIES: RNA polymerase sigma factor [Winogradskyella]|uniref:Sigma-70 family RNA polymerase sigma factor n=1 Tax=Winogradskyella ouciana TaxID=2608631 RepID=A0A7K1GF27_9FLAO|nr:MULTISPECIES: sigma-70 family RNA polymerase sigma factor [Winogradskyella]MBO6881412.1 sigma-70 family RNA polymerase sigma factor [Winogradskyella sp.]MTE27900.1 sigma-70 family RNA polymerase sigma factor [Winogradskyella ouciana]
MSQPIQNHICEEQLFERLYKKHSKNLHDFLYYKFGENLNPQDKVQEAFIKLWQNCSKVSPDKAKSFLFTTANNLMLNAVAHKKVVLKYQKLPQKHSTNESPEFVMQEKEYHQKLQNALANLTEAQRVAFLMNRVEGKRFKEIAELLDISTKAVEKRIYGALKKLRKDIDGL